MAICISDNIRVLRQKNDYTLEQLAEIIGVSRQTIAKWESGETLPDIVNCGKLSALFKVTLDEFVTIQLSNSEAVDKDENSGKMMGVVSVDAEGRISIPEQVRDLLDIQTGEKVLLLVEFKNNPATTAGTEEHRAVIESEAKEGYAYAGYFPVKMGPSGKMLVADLVFQK